MDKLEAMETFVKIVDEGSLTAAARAMDKAQPTVVRSLALLEDELGVRLLHRTTRRMSLTPEGQTYLERCRQILSDVKEAENLLLNEATELRGALRVTAPVLFGTLRVAPLIHGFLQRAPRVHVELVLLDRVVNLVEEGFDLGVRIAHLDDSSLIATRVGEVGRRCVASRAFLREYGRPKHPKDLNQMPAVVFNQNHFLFQERGQSLAVRPPGRFSTNQAQAGVAACEAGVGIGQFLSYQTEEALCSRRLKRVLKDFETPATPVQLVYPHSRLLSARQRALLDWLKKGLSS